MYLLDTFPAHCIKERIHCERHKAPGTRALRAPCTPPRPHPQSAATETDCVWDRMQRGEFV